MTAELKGESWEQEWLPADFTGFLLLGPDETGYDDDDRFAKKGKGKVESMLLGVEFLEGSIVGPARIHTVHSEKAGTTLTITTPTDEWTGEPAEAETHGLVSVVPSPHVLQGVNGTKDDLTFDMLTVQSRLDLIVSPVEPNPAQY